MRALVLSTVFPNPEQPSFGVFVAERTRRIAALCDLAVVAPIPWFPMNERIRGVRARAIPHLETRDGITVHHPRVFCVPRYGKSLDGLLYALSLVPVLARIRRRFPFDVIDAHFAYPDGLAATLLGVLFRRPVVITLRGSIVRLAAYRLHRPQLRWALERAARVLSVSQALKQVAVGLGTPPEKIRVIPNGVDTAVFRPRGRAAARAELGLPPDRTIVLSVGSIDEHKGHHRVIAGLPEIASRHRDVLFVIVGLERPGQSSRPLLERMIGGLGLERHVRIVGPQPHDRIPLWMSAADLFCLATKSEGWPNVLLESLACGLPVVATRVGGVPEVVTDEHLGILVPPADDAALAKAIVDGIERSWDPAVLIAHAGTHSWNVAAAGVVEEFRRAAPGAGRR
ncbi:MAG: glycosyltransferase family 4 protein [Candidatus Rokubacteria bacterium]|nr:glycosyltransferase family 4 protein [Candidatus Rokubacteria bacterium]